MQNTPVQTASQQSLDTLATRIGASLRQKFGLDISPDAVAAILADSVRAGEGVATTQPAPRVQPSQASALSSIHEMVRIARDEGRQFSVDVVGGQNRVHSTHQGKEEVLGGFSGPFVKELAALTRTGLPVDVAFATVVKLDDGSYALVSVKQVAQDIQYTDARMHRFTVTAAPVVAPAIALDDLGITQVSRWREAVEFDTGLCLVSGGGVHSTLRATAAHLEDEGRKVVWVWGIGPQADVAELDADVYVFERKLREPSVTNVVLKLAQSALVLASCALTDLHQAVEFLARCSRSAQLVDEVLVAALRQHLFSGDVGADNQASKPVLVTECATFFNEEDTLNVLQGVYAARWLGIDVAEKVRSRQLSEQAARDVFPEEMSVYF